MPKGSLHNKFNDFGAAPSENVWSGIEKSLDNKKKKRVVVIWWTTGLAAAFLVLFGIKSFYKTSSTIETNQQSNTSDVDSKKGLENIDVVNKEEPQYTIKEREKDSEGIDKNVEDKIGENLSLEFKANNIKKKIDEFDFLIVKENEQERDSELESEEKSIEKIEKVDKANVAKIDLKVIPNVTREYSLLSVPYKLIDFYGMPTVLNTELENLQQSKLQRRKWSYSLAVQSNLGLISSETEPDGLANFSMSDPGGNNPPIINDPFILKETRPLNLRLGVEREITKRLKINSGLDLSYIRRHSTKLYSEDYITDKIYSFGIPIGLNYNYLNNKRWNFNVEANFLNDFAFITRSKSNELPANYTVVTASSLESSQVSSSTSFNYLRGVELINEFDYSLNENIRLTFSPGIKRYLNTTYLFNLKTFLSFNAGLKWHF